MADKSHEPSSFGKLIAFVYKPWLRDRASIKKQPLFIGERKEPREKVK